jgi:nitrogen PTS system EIIA component
MKLKDLLTPELTVCHTEDVLNKKQALSLISDMIANADSRIKSKRILEVLMDREQLGSTTVGHGFAIPHARIASLKKAICVLISFNQPIDFDDENQGQGVDIIFGLLVPEEATEEHLQILGDIASHIKAPHYRQQLRQASNNEQMYRAAIQSAAE